MRDWKTVRCFSGVFVFGAVTVLLLLNGCSSDKSNTAPTVNTPTVSGGWNCAASTDCQDVYDVQLASGVTVTFEATNIGGDSLARIAIYGPLSALSGTNLINNTTADTLCNFDSSGCQNNTSGQIASIVTGTTGTYRFAVTRDWGYSCSASGTYDLYIRAGGQASLSLVQTVDDQASQASGSQCP